MVASVSGGITPHGRQTQGTRLLPKERRVPVMSVRSVSDRTDRLYQADQ
ncbi:hypothetical protein BIFDEN_02467 [Bifidobacterium dentium ATCC 27678]|nr:hypothetical protein BIFDEN_02467 [Bifidobacterium dentium ATCC 27678]